MRTPEKGTRYGRGPMPQGEKMFDFRRNAATEKRNALIQMLMGRLGEQTDMTRNEMTWKRDTDPSADDWRRQLVALLEQRRGIHDDLREQQTWLPTRDWFSDHPKREMPVGLDGEEMWLLPFADHYNQQPMFWRKPQRRTRWA